MRYTVIDFETTGLEPAQDEVIEFAAVRVCDGEIGLHLSSLCRPRAEIPAKITQITGITGAMTQEYPLFETFLPSLLDFIGTDSVAAHNAPFDMGFLRAYCHRAGRIFSPAELCTVRMARRQLPHLPNHRLQTVAEHLGVGSGGYHRALGDAMTTAEILIRLLAREKAPSAGNR